MKPSFLLFHLFIYKFSSLIKWFLSSDLNFHLIFPLIFYVLAPIYYNVWLFISFCMSDSNDNTTSIKQRSHIKSLFVIMLHQT